MFLFIKKEVYAFRIVLFLAVVVIFTLTLMKPSNLPEISIHDKLAHFLAFFVLAFLADFAFHPARVRTVKTLLLLSFGGVIELTQHFTSWRSAEWLDLIADLSGILCYWLISPFIIKCIPWREKNEKY